MEPYLRSLSLAENPHARSLKEFSRAKEEYYFQHGNLPLTAKEIIFRDTEIVLAFVDDQGKMLIS